MAELGLKVIEGDTEVKSTYRMKVLQGVRCDDVQEVAVLISSISSEARASWRRSSRSTRPVKFGLRK